MRAYYRSYPFIMLNLEHFDLQAEKFAKDITHIAAYHSERLSRLYGNPAEQVCRLAHTINEPVLYISSRAPADVAAEIQTAYEQRFF